MSNFENYNAPITKNSPEGVPSLPTTAVELTEFFESVRSRINSEMQTEITKAITALSSGWEGEQGQSRFRQRIHELYHVINGAIEAETQEHDGSPSPWKAH